MIATDLNAETACTSGYTYRVYDVCAYRCAYVYV